MAKNQSATTEAGAVDMSFPTVANLSAKQYRFVKRDATTGNIVACGANEQPLGVLQNAPNGSTREDVAIVRIAGVSKLKLAGTVTPSSWIQSDTNGEGTPNTTNNRPSGAMALSDGTSGDLIAVLVAPSVMGA